MRWRNDGRKERRNIMGRGEKRGEKREETGRKRSGRIRNKGQEKIKTRKTMKTMKKEKNEKNEEISTLGGKDKTGEK